MNRYFYTILLWACFIIGCGNGNDSDSVQTEPPKEEQKTDIVSHVIYELNVRNFSSAGTFAGAKNGLTRLQNLGIDILWIMPIHPSGEVNRNGSLGSPYAVQDYYAVSPDFGSMTDFKSLVEAAHQKGMQVWLDWVANHTAWDHAWTISHPEYYKKQGGEFYSPMDWADVIQLDYDNADLQTAMIDAMAYWVEETGIDGFRCDYAEGPSANFWHTVIQGVNNRATTAGKSLTWLAEGQVPQLAGNANDQFDYDFAWTFSDALNSFGENNDVAALKSACLNLYNNPDYNQAGRLVYLTNHDLNAYSGTEFDRYGNNLLPLTVLEFTIYDMPLLYNGQEIGYNTSMGLFDYAKINWNSGNSKISALIQNLIALKHSSKALTSGANRGALTFFSMSNDNVLCYARQKGESRVLVMLNLGSNSQTVTFGETVPAGTYKNYLNNADVEINASSSFNLTANGYAVYTTEHADETAAPPVEGITFDGSTHLYFNHEACTWFGNDEAVPCIAFNGSVNYADMELVDECVYQYLVPAGNYQNATIARHCSNGTWNPYSFDLEKDKNYYIANSGNWDQAGGSWAIYEE